MINNNDDLYTLVQSLNKSEKRFFRLHTKLFSKNKKPHYLILFDILDNMSEYNHKLVAKSIKDSTDVKNVSQLKNYLTEQIIDSLSLFYKSKNDLISNIENWSISISLSQRYYLEESEKILETQKKQSLEKELFAFTSKSNQMLMYLKQGKQSSREEQLLVAQYHKEETQTLEKEKERLQLLAVLSEVGMIVASKQNALKKQTALKEELDKINLVNYDNLKSFHSKFIYHNILSNIYSSLENTQEQIHSLEEQYRLLDTPQLQNCLWDKCLVLTSLLKVYLSLQKKELFQNIFIELEEILQTTPSNFSGFNYLKFLYLIEFHLQTDSPKLSNKRIEEIKIFMTAPSNNLNEEEHDILQKKLSKCSK